MSEAKSGIRPIQEKFLQNNYLMAIEFLEGFVFGRVIRRRICQYKPLALVDTTGAVVNINPKTHQPELRFLDPRNPAVDVLFLDRATIAGYAIIYHGAIGIMPQYIYMYPRFPEGKEIPGKFPIIDPIRPVEGDFIGYINSLKSPYEEPTDFVEWVIPPYIHVGAEYYNWDEQRAHQPVLNLLFALYFFEVLRPPKHAKLISQIARRAIPAAFLTVGWGDKPEPIGDMLMKEWKVTPLSIDEAIELWKP